MKELSNLAFTDITVVPDWQTALNGSLLRVGAAIGMRCQASGHPCVVLLTEGDTGKIIQYGTAGIRNQAIDVSKIYKVSVLNPIARAYDGEKDFDTIGLLCHAGGKLYIRASMGGHRVYVLLHDPQNLQAIGATSIDGAPAAQMTVAGVVSIVPIVPLPPVS